MPRIPYREQGWNFWRWQNHNIHYVQAGQPSDLRCLHLNILALKAALGAYATKQTRQELCLAAGESGPPIVLVHGFGASAYHWRYNIPELAKKHRVFAVDLVGAMSAAASCVSSPYHLDNTCTPTCIVHSRLCQEGQQQTCGSRATGQRSNIGRAGMCL